MTLIIIVTIVNDNITKIINDNDTRSNNHKITIKR